MILEKKVEKKIDNKLINELSTEFNINPEIIKLMIFRGIDTKAKIDEFLNADIKNLHNPFLLKDMDKAVNKINNMIANKKHILIFGDYDVDGMSATSILYLYLKSKNVKVSYFLPNRYVDGYGITKSSLTKIKQLFNPDLIITVDCGITAVEEIEYAKQLGIDVIITDHHEVPDITPNCLIINPKIKNQKYPFNELCGAGVALKLLHALGGIEVMKSYLDIAAIATIADIVALQGENRLLVQLGLKQIKSDPREGFKLLFKELNLKSNLTSTEIAFKVAPKINAAGRMGEAEVGLKIFIELDKNKLQSIVKKLLLLNTKRQELCQAVYDDAINKLDKINMTKLKIIILSDKNWDAGLLGITAARLADEFNRPIILFSEVDGKFKGSARSIDGIDIHNVISRVKSPIEAFGGHTMAAGITIAKEHYKAFKTQVEECVNSKYDASYFYPKKYYDLDLIPKEVSIKFIKELNLLEPFGHRNPLPIFNLAFKNAKIKSMKNFPEHLTINFNKEFSLLNFNSSHNLPNFYYYTNKNALIQLQLNTFRGKESVKGIVKTLGFNNVNFKLSNGFINAYYLMQLSYEPLNKNIIVNNYKKQNTEQIFVKLVKESGLGNLFVFNKEHTYKKYLKLIKKLNLQTYLFNVGNKLGLNACVLGLSNFNNLNSYNNVVFVDSVINNAYLEHLSLNTNAKIYVLDNSSKKDIIKVSRKRQIFGLYFNAFKHASDQRIKASNIYNYFEILKKANRHIQNFNSVQFLACLNVFKELNIIEDEVTKTSYKLKVNSKVKSSLENSKLYNKLKSM